MVDRVYRLEIHSVLLVFSTFLWTSAPLIFSLVHLPPPPLRYVSKYRGMDTVTHVGIFDPLLWTSAFLTFSLVHLPPPFPAWISIGVVFIQCVTGGWGGDRVVWRAYAGVIHYVFWPDFEPKKLLYHPNKNLGGEGGLRQINTCYQVPLMVNF